jgi:hypothetical protein
VLNAGHVSVLWKVHNELMAGHQGAAKILNLISRVYF